MRFGRGKPTKNIGKQKSGANGADNATETIRMKNTNGKKAEEMINVATVAPCLCLGSVQDVMNIVNINFAFSMKSLNLLQTKPINISCSPMPSPFHHSLVTSHHVIMQRIDNSTRDFSVFCQT